MSSLSQIWIKSVRSGRAKNKATTCKCFTIRFRSKTGKLKVLLTNLVVQWHQYSLFETYYHRFLNLNSRIRNLKSGSSPSVKGRIQRRNHFANHKVSDSCPKLLAKSTSFNSAVWIRNSYLVAHLRSESSKHRLTKSTKRRMTILSLVRTQTGSRRDLLSLKALMKATTYRSMLKIPRSETATKL